MKWIKTIANLGYGSRKLVAKLLHDGHITDSNGEPINDASKLEFGEIRIDGKPLDPAFGSVLMLHKPVGFTCSTRDHGALVYDLLPPRLRTRKPLMSTIGRLDRDTSGLLLLTDDGALLHRITSPRHATPKIYEVSLDRDLRGDEVELFASGKMLLEDEPLALKPAHLQLLDARRARLTLTEGRYHQVRRMFAAVGNHVLALHRSQVGELTLQGLAPREWRVLDEQELHLLNQRQDSIKTLADR